MSIGGWWSSAQGRAYRDVWRWATTARGRVNVTPKAKGATGQRRERDLILEAARSWQNKYGEGWPRPRAEVALDVWAVTRRNPPQPQNFAKRLLDQLGNVDGKPIIYFDDRQVSMLFVRVDAFEGGPFEPMIRFAAQRASLVREGLRLVDDETRDELGAPWPIPSMDAQLRAVGPEHRFQDRWDRENDWWRRIQDADDEVDMWRHSKSKSELARRRLARAEYNATFVRQEQTLAACDDFAADLLTSFARRRRGDLPLFREMDLLRKTDAISIALWCSMPYAIDLGVLPTKPGDTTDFRNNLRSILSDRIASNRTLFPLLCSVGVSVFYVPSQKGKDLDNIFRLVVPVLLGAVKPPIHSKHPGALDEDGFGIWNAVRRGEQESPESRIAFIEAVALKGLPLSPGSAILTLSHGDRHQSWWQRALELTSPHDRLERLTDPFLTDPLTDPY